MVVYGGRAEWWVANKMDFGCGSVKTAPVCAQGHSVEANKKVHGLPMIKWERSIGLQIFNY